MTRKCEAVLVQFVVKTYNDEGVQSGETVLQPLKVYKGQNVDIWQLADDIVARAAKEE